MELVTETVVGEAYQYVSLGQHVVRALGVCGGRPTFKYTRIEVAGALNRLAAGESLEKITEGYEGKIPREAILEAVDIAVQRLLDSLPVLPTSVAA